MSLNVVSLIGAWVATMDAHGNSDVCAIPKTGSSRPRFLPMIFRFSREEEVIIEVQRWVDGEMNSSILRLKPGNGWVTVQDRQGNPIAQFIPCKSRAEANHEIRQQLMNAKVQQERAAAA